LRKLSGASAEVGGMLACVETRVGLISRLVKQTLAQVARRNGPAAQQFDLIGKVFFGCQTGPASSEHAVSKL
jgi:hypothetical protein